MAVLKAIQNNSKITCDKNHFPDPKLEKTLFVLERVWEPKVGKNDTQNESKFQTMFKSAKVAIQEPLGAVLGRSWGILEGMLGSNMALRYTRACVW